MSKFCNNCGKQLDDAVRFCDGCGAPQDAVPQTVAPEQPVVVEQPQYQPPQVQQSPYYQPPQQYATPQQPQYAAPQQPQYAAPQQPQYPVPQQPRRQAPAGGKPSFDFNKLLNEVKTVCNGLINRCKVDKKFMYTCIGIAGGALLAIILLIVLLSGGGMTQPIDTLIDVTFEGKVSKIKNLAPAEYWDYLEEEYDVEIDEIIEEAEDEFDDMMDELEDQYGKNIRVTYKVVDKKKLSDKKLEGIAEALADEYGLDEDKFTEAYDLEVEMTIKGSEDDDEDESEITVIKYKGKWYAITWYKSGSNYSASFITDF